MRYIILNLMICAMYILFAGILRSKYYQDIRHKGIETASEFVFVSIIVTSVVYVLFIHGESPIVRMGICLLMYLCELLAIGYAFYVMPSLAFEYEKQKKYARIALFATTVLAIVQAGNFLCFF